MFRWSALISWLLCSWYVSRLVHRWGRRCSPSSPWQLQTSSWRAQAFWQTASPTSRYRAWTWGSGPMWRVRGALGGSCSSCCRTWGGLADPCPPRYRSQLGTRPSVGKHSSGPSSGRPSPSGWSCRACRRRQNSARCRWCVLLCTKTTPQSSLLSVMHEELIP